MENNLVKGKSGAGNNDIKNTKKRKGSENEGWSSVEPKVKKSRNSVNDGVGSISVLSDGPEFGQNLERSTELIGFSLNLDGGVIPRKPRGFVGRKIHVAKQSGSSVSVDLTNQMKSDFKDGGVCVLSTPQHAKKKRKQIIIDKESLVDLTANLNSDWKDPTIAVPNIPQRDKKTIEQMNIDKGDLVDQTARLNCDFKNRATAIQSTAQHAMERRKGYIIDGGNVSNASSRKRQGHLKKRKGLPLDLEFSEKALPAAGYSKGIPEIFMDDEENLVKKAAVILSSGSDPLCTGPSKTKSSLSHSGGDTGIHTENLQASFECPSPDNASRIPIPRYNNNQKGNPRKRRRFYEVKYTGQDAGWFLNKRIKVFRPLDERWYHGIVSDYSEGKKLYCVNYDDKDKEWINLQEVRFMLLLLRSEVTDVKKPLQFCADDKLIDKTGKDSTMSETDSEIIMALLALSPSPATFYSAVKTQKSFLPSSSDSQPSSRNTTNARRISNVCLLETDTNELCFSNSADRLADEANGEELMLEHAARPKETRLPIVFYRKPFPTEKGVSFADRFSVLYKQDGLVDCIKPKRLIFTIDSPFKEFLTQLSLLVCSLLDLPFGSYGSMVMMRWPWVYLEMIFVDNEGGSRSFLLESCLKRLLSFVFVVLAVFYAANEQRESVGLEIPITSVGFKLSGSRKQPIFAFHCFMFKNGLLEEVGRGKPLRDIVPYGISRFGLENRRQHPNDYVKHGMLTFNLCFSAAPLFFRSLHFKLLLESSIASVRLRPHCCLIQEIDVDKSNMNERLSEIQRASDNNSPLNDGIVYNSNTIIHNIFSTRYTKNWSSSLPSHGEGTNVVHSAFGNGPRKPQTQVHYATPSGSSKFRSGHKPLRHNGYSFRKIRGASEKMTSDDSRGSQRNLELLVCEANVLITIADQCWRELGAQVAIELADQNEWRLSVKFSGSTKYSHKVDNVFQRGSTNSYTRAMMWKGGKDWALEFTNRNQWMIFKEIYEECYNRNISAASVKNIPIPGVRLVAKCEDNAGKFPFTRPKRYLRKIENDIDLALNPLKILYDMDSEDEQWILRNEKSLRIQESSCRVVTYDLFEKTMDMLEKFAYAQQRDHFTAAEIENFMVGAAPSEVIDSIYQHWQQKRKRIGRPLIRHLQPPSWERFQQKLQEWNQSMTQVNNTATGGGNTTALPVEKPAMFAFCLKPRGLEVPRKGFKHRLQKKFHVAGHRHGLIEDHHDERRANNNTSNFDNHPKLLKTKLKDINMQLGVQYLDEISVRETVSAAKRASNFARFKREKAERLFFKADIARCLAKHALFTADAVKAASCPSEMDKDKNERSKE